MLNGAQAHARRIDADVGGTLYIESPQDTVEQESKQSGGGIRAQVALGTAWSVSGNYNQSKASGHSRSVGSQSGLFAGEGGYHIKADSVRLKGGAIASAADKDHNELTARSFSFEDIRNESSYSASSMGIGAGYGGSLKGSDGFNQSAFGRASQTAGQNIKQGLNYSPTLPQHESGGSQGYTRSVLSEGNITIGDQATSARALGIQTDLQNAHRSAEAVPDLQNLLDKQQTVAQSTAVIHSAVATYSGNRAKAAAEELEKQQAAYEGRLKEQNDGSYEQYAGKSDSERLSMRLGNAKYAQAYQEARSWGVGGSKSRALSAAETLITGALGGQGDLQLAANTLAPYAAAAIGKRFGHGENKNEAAQAIGHFMLGAALAYANGADPLAGGSAAVAAERAAEYLAKQYDDGKTAIDPITGKFNPNLLPEHIKEEIKAQTGAIASVVGAAGGSLNGSGSTNGNSNALFNAQVGGVLGQNAVENNLLNNEDRKKYDLLTEKILNHTASNKEKAEFERLAAKDQVSNELYRKYYSDLHRKDGKKDLTTQEAASLRSYLDIIYDDQKILDRKIKNDLYQGKEILRNGEPYYPFWLAKRDRKVREHWNNSWKEIQDARGKYKTGLAAVKHFFLSEGRPIGKYEKAWNILERDKAYADSFEGRAAASTAQGIALGLEFTTRGRYLMMAIGGAQASYGTYQITQGNLEHGKANFFLGAGTMLGSVSLGGASVKKSPLAIHEPIPAGYNRPPTSLDVNAGRMANQFSTAHQKVTDLNILFAKPSKTVSNSKVGIQWNNGIGKQGMPWENYVGKNLPSDARLPKNFKTFDYYDSRDGLAISAKTLDTQTASRMLKPRQIYSTLKNYIDKAANFKIYSLSGVELNANTIRRREIHLAIPAQTTKEQWQQINKAIEYGKTHNVNVKVTEIK